MNTTPRAELSAIWLERLPQLMRRHALLSYFLMAFILTWIWEILALEVFHLPSFLVLIPGPFIGPTFSAFFMTALIEGKVGVLRLLRRYLLWRVPFTWYLVVILGRPALFLISVLALPGAFAAFHPPTLAFGLSYVGLYLTIFFIGGPLGEEPGWRGFALPRLQQRLGALPGTLLLGVLHALWHLPLYLFIPGYNGVGAGLLGIGMAFGQFVVAIAAESVIFTWVFNNTRGSLLLVMLLHASVNTASQILHLFPSLAPTPQLSLIHSSVVVVVALLIIVATRWHLCYERTIQKDVLPASAPSDRTNMVGRQ